MAAGADINACGLMIQVLQVLWKFGRSLFRWFVRFHRMLSPPEK